MKNRALQSLLSINLVLLFLVGSISGVAASLIIPSHAAAGTSANYIFDYPNDSSSLAAFKKALDDQEQSAGAFQNTAVYVRGGVFGDKPLAMKINVGRTGCAQSTGIGLAGACHDNDDHFGGQSGDVYVYSATYTCKPGADPVFSAGDTSQGDEESYVVDFNVSLKLGKTGADHAFFDKNGKPHDTVKMHWVGFGSTDSAGVKYYAAAQNGVARPPAEAKRIIELPAKCAPPNIPNDVLHSIHDDTEKNNKGIVNFDIAYLQNASKSVKDLWGDLSTVANSPAGSAGDNSTPGLSCNVSFNPITWLICPVVKGMVTIVGQIDNIISRQLTVGSVDGSSSPSKIFCQSDNPNDPNCEASAVAYHQAWASVRNIALGLLVIAGLVVVIAQALGTELLDAYTIKKILPRILFAAIGITLSWPLMQFFVQFSNDLGFGIRFIIYHPFASFNDATLGGGATVTGGLIGAGAISALGIFGLLSFAGTAALAVLVAFIVLILRQLLIIVLIIFAPIALVAYVLPNTQNIYKLWWDSFMKALMMFPIIAAMIATGRVFAVVSGQDTSNSSLGQLLGFVAYFAPYFLIPLAFRFAGGAIRGIGGFVNDRSKGGFDRLKGYRKGKIEHNTAGMKNFSRFSERNAAGRAINTAIGTAANPTSMLRGRSGIAATRKARQATHGAGLIKDSEIFQANQGDDAFLLAVADRSLANQFHAKAIADSQDMTKTAAERTQAEHTAANYQHALDAAAQLGSSGRSRAVRANALSALAKTGFQFAQGQEGYNQLSQAARSIAGSDDGAYSSLMNEAQYGLRTAGRYDLGGINHGAGFDPKSGLDKGSLYEIANGKKDSITELATSVGHGPVGNQHAVVYKELEAMLPNSKGGNRDEIVKQMDNLESMGVKDYMMHNSGQQEKYRENYNPARHGVGPIVPGWTAAEVSRGWREQTRDLSNGEVAQKAARAYERPDPNRNS